MPSALDVCSLNHQTPGKSQLITVFNGENGPEKEMDFLLYALLWSKSFRELMYMY